MANRDPKEVKISRGSLRIGSGAYVGCGGKVYRISHVLDTGRVVGVSTEDGKAEVLEIGKLEEVVAPDMENAGLVKRELADIDDREWATVERRLRVIEPLIRGASREEVERIAAEKGIHYTTVYRWYRRYLDGGGVTGLLPRKSGYPKGKKRIEPEADRIVREVIEKYYLTKQRPKVSALIRMVRIECAKRNVEPPSANTIRNRVKEIDAYTNISRRMGREVAKDKLSPAPGKFVAEYPLHVVQMDHTEADIILVDEETRQPVGRPFLTVAIDIFSRMPCGLYLSFDPPGSVSVGMCAVSCILPKDDLLEETGVGGEWPIYGLMDILHVDNGADFRAEALERACLAHGIRLDFRPVGETQFGGHVERLIGTLMDETHLLPGTTFSDTKERGSYDPEAEACMTLAEYEAWLVKFITEVYNRRVHAELGTTPAKKLEEGIFGDGRTPGSGLPRVPASPRTLLIDFLPVFRRTVQRNGVNIDGVNYYDTVLRQHIGEIDPDSEKKKKFVFRRDPRDISYVWFYDEDTGSHYRIPAADQSFPPMSAWELANAKRLLKERNEKIVDERAILAAHEELHERAMEAKKKTKRARRAVERKKVANRHLERLEGARTDGERDAAKGAGPEDFPTVENDDIWDDIPDFDVE